MPHGGTLAIETEKVHLKPEEAARLDLTPGDWVILDVRDTGEGMTDEVRAHLFEPFFTTKPVGKGTGLGLATCHGIVHQSGGKIVAESAPGKGTRFRIYLPRSLEAPLPHAASEAPQSNATSPATILVVEDAPFVRALTVRILRASGYTVLEAESGAAADRVVDEFDRPIDLLLSDVVMPGESGAQLAARFRQTRPDLAVLFMSGYSGDVQLERGVAREGVPVLDKPFLPDKLLDSVRKALESNTDPARRDR
jgi:CheY-like chemotaxis protein